MSIFDPIKRLFGGGAANGASTPGDGTGEVAMIGCAEALEQVYEYLDGELGDASEEQVRIHFEVCKRCYPHLRFEEAFLNTVRRAGECESAPVELKQKIAAMLSEADDS